MRFLTLSAGKLVARVLNALAVTFDPSTSTLTSDTVQGALEELALNVTDHHSGVNCLLVGEELTILENRQMTIWGVMKNDGILNVDGQLIIEA